MSVGKKKLLVSFSGGETSAYMAQWLWKHKQNEYDMVFVFANTGQENEETLNFVEKCSDYFGFPVVWVEAVVFHGKRKSSGHKVVNYESASRIGEPFEEVIKKYGIPNQQFPHCTRETKLNPITSYMKSVGWHEYYTAIGIRSDEADRISAKAKENKLIYPLISDQPMTKPKINFWWNQQPFRLNLKGYQGNCKWCWKKGDPKLFKLAQEDESLFDFPLRMEKEYGNYIPESRIKLMNERGEKPELPIVFFRQNRSAKEIIKQSESFRGRVSDDAQHYEMQISLFEATDLIGGESCEIWAECGS